MALTINRRRGMETHMKTAKRLTLRAALIATLLILDHGFSSAQSAAQIETKFAAADKDGDGKLTTEEAKAGMPRVAANFAKIDRGHKGFVTVEDIKEAMALMNGR